MATMRDMPYMAGKVVTVRSWHKPQLNPLKGYFHPQKGASKPDIDTKNSHNHLYFSWLPWSDPGTTRRDDPVKRQSRFRDHGIDSVIESLRKESQMKLQRNGGGRKIGFITPG